MFKMKKYDLETHLYMLDIMYQIAGKVPLKEYIGKLDYDIYSIFSYIKMLLSEPLYLYALPPEKWEFVYTYIDYFRYQEGHLNQKYNELCNNMIDYVNQRLIINRAYYCLVNKYNELQMNEDENYDLQYVNDIAQKKLNQVNQYFSIFSELDNQICYEIIYPDIIVNNLWFLEYNLLLLLYNEQEQKTIDLLLQTYYVEAAIISIINKHEKELLPEDYDIFRKIILERNNKEYLTINSVIKSKGDFKKIDTKETKKVGKIIMKYMKRQTKEKTLQKNK